MKRLPALFLLIFFISATYAQNYPNSIDFVDIHYGQNGQFSILFNIRDQDGNKQFANIEKDTLRFFENSKKIEADRIELLGSQEKGNISENITVSILVDQSESLRLEKESIKEAVRSIVEKVPSGCVYISFFGTSVSSGMPISKENFENFSEEFSRTDKYKALYNAMYAKLFEFEGDRDISRINYSTNKSIGERARQTKNYLVVLTDGNDNPSLNDNNIRLNELNDYADSLKTEIKIFAIRYGKTKQVSQSYTIDDILKSICYSRKVRPDLRGDFFKASPDSVLNRMDKVMEDIKASYALHFTVCGKTYAGESTRYSLRFGKAYGEKIFVIASPETPVVITACGEEGGSFLSLLYSILTGILFFLVIFIVLQLIVPSIRNLIFKLRYYKKYDPAPNEMVKLCGVCRGKINKGDDIVARCEHIVHKRCWEEQGHQCPEYGQNCKVGKQVYFDINDPFSSKNRQPYLSWVLYGLIAGFITWFLYRLILMISPQLFFNFSDMLTKTFYIGFENKDNLYQGRLLTAFHYRIPGLLKIGLLLGFLLSLLFSLLNEFRKKDFKVYLLVLLRSLIGMMAGFVAYLLGCIIMLLFSPSPDTNLWWLYSIPGYLLFGISIGLCLSIKSTISWKHGVLGGLVSILIGFIILYAANALLKEYGTMITFMIYGAGLGFSIATVRSYSENYFLRVSSNNAKERNIAIHKWMNSSGGSASVYIGMAGDCEIQMNWDKSEDIAKKHVRLYYNKEKKIAMLHVLEKGVVLNKREDLRKGVQYPLRNGDEFRIGKTLFMYFEKEK